MTTQAVVAVITREFRVLWLRCLIMAVILVSLILYNLDRGRSADLSFMFVLLTGLILGIDFGIRDRINGFDLSLLTLPVNQSHVAVIRLLLRLIPVIVFACLAGLFFGDYELPNREIFWLVLTFFASIVASVCARKIIIAACIATALAFGWTVLNTAMGVGFLQYTDGLSLARIQISTLTLRSQALPIFRLLALLIMFGITIKVVIGRQGHENRYSNPLSVSYVARFWLGGILLCILGFLTVPSIISSTPIQSAKSFYPMISLSGTDALLVGAMDDELPIGTWLISPDHHIKLENTHISYGQRAGQSSQFLALITHHGLPGFRVYSKTNENGIASLELKRTLQGKSFFGSLDRRAILPVSEDNQKIAVAIYTKMNRRHVISHVSVVDLENSENDWDWTPVGFKTLKRLVVCGWLDNETISVFCEDEEGSHLWKVRKGGFQECYWRTDPELQVRPPQDIIPKIRFHPEHKSVFMPLGKPNSNKDPKFSNKDLILLEVWPDGSVYTHDVPWIDAKISDFRIITGGTKLFIQYQSDTQIYNLKTQECQTYQSYGHGSSTKFSPDGSFRAGIEKIDSMPTLIVTDLVTDQEVQRVNGVMEWLWMSDTKLAVLIFDGKLSRLNVETGEFTEYFDFDWGLK